MKKHFSRFLLTLAMGLFLLPATRLATTAHAATHKLTLLQINILNAGGNDAGFKQTIKIMKASKADIIAVSEVRADSTDENNPGPTGPSIAAKLGKAMGYYYYDQSGFYEADKARTGDHPAIWANAVLSKYPLGEGSPLGLGVEINVDGRKIHVFSLNLDYKPYPPYQINNIEYEGYPFIKTEKEAVHYANIAHEAAVKELTTEIKTVAKNSEAVFVLGDFNEPSHRDWTKKAVAAKLHPVAVAWPTTKTLEKLGFVDTYRAIHKDEVQKPGFTWTPTTAENDPQDHHDRIDFIFARAKNLKVNNSLILGEKSERADIVITPWPTDHRAVVTELEF